MIHLFQLAGMAVSVIFFFRYFFIFVFRLELFENKTLQLKVSLPLIAPWKGLQDSLGRWIPRGHRFLAGGTWIPDSLSCIPDSKARDSGFQVLSTTDAKVIFKNLPPIHQIFFVFVPFFSKQIVTKQNKASLEISYQFLAS